MLPRIATVTVRLSEGVGRSGTVDERIGLDVIALLLVMAPAYEMSSTSWSRLWRAILLGGHKSEDAVISLSRSEDHPVKYSDALGRDN